MENKHDSQGREYPTELKLEMMIVFQFHVIKETVELNGSFGE